jgi:vacuolar-type H+-ATPase subunit H
MQLIDTADQCNSSSTDDATTKAVQLRQNANDYKADSAESNAIAASSSGCNNAAEANAAAASDATTEADAARPMQQLP